jgi:hypothetical protein
MVGPWTMLALGLVVPLFVSTRTSIVFALCPFWRSGSGNHNTSCTLHHDARGQIPVNRQRVVSVSLPVVSG